MSDEFDAVVERVSERIEPDSAERAALDSAVEALVERTEAALAERGLSAEVVQVGSTARDTWLAGNRDIDLFVSFPPEMDPAELESHGLELGHEVLPNGHEEYAEHPYVVGEFDGFEVDFVPCYAVEDATQIQSAVDRTPFHSRYLRDRLTPSLAADVRVCKQFFEGIGVYGSDLKTRGFSGFLTELLVLEHGGFRPLIDAAADWKPPVRFDPEDHGAATFEDPLVVIDPTDPERNVAAVLSAANLARLQHFARDLLTDPREGLFTPPALDPASVERVTEAFERRGTTPVAVRFETPDIVDDQLWPQLERSREGVASELDRRGFDVFRSTAFAAETSVLLFELAVAERPRIERHEGPPVAVREHAGRFYEAYADDEDVFGPFIAEGRYVVERDRKYATAAAFFDSDALFDVALGTHVETALDAEYDVLVGDDVATLAEAFGQAFAKYLSPGPLG